jgi:hypothetical protein
MAYARHADMATSWAAAARHLPPAEGIAVNDEDFAALEPTERDFALRWVRMTDTEQEWFCRNLLAAIEVLQRLGVLEPPQPTDGMLPA